MVILVSQSAINRQINDRESYFMIIEDIQVEACLEQICQQGCHQVNIIIQQLKPNQAWFLQAEMSLRGKHY